ncbi:MAG: DUF4390 domain-containing protein [Neisseria sp.]|nr:DUF4390 domain-containing protein [Neisseria sp.]
MVFITRLFKNSKILLCAVLFSVFLLLPVQVAQAESIAATRAIANITADGRLSVNSRFKTELPDALKQALKQGVPLHFTLSYQLSAPTWAAYKFKLGQVLDSDNSINYKLSFHPLTNRYRLTVGTFSSEYNSLETALRGIGAIANWRVLSSGTLNDVAANKVKAEIRLSLSTSQLPKPFQINSVSAKNWQLDSGWKSLSISKD